MSVQVRNRTNNGTYVISSVETHGAQVAGMLGAVDAALPTAERLGTPAIEAFLVWLGRVLGKDNAGLAAAEAAYVREQADDPAVRQARDKAFAALLSSTIQTRDRVLNVFGPSALATYGLQKPAPRTLEPLQAYAGTVVKLLREHPRTAVDALDSELDTTRVAAALEQKLVALDANLEQLLVEKRELDAAMLARNEKMTDWGRSYRGVAGALASLYHLAGETELAERVRPTERRATGVDTATDEPADSPPDQDADTGADAPLGAVEIGR